MRVRVTCIPIMLRIYTYLPTYTMGRGVLYVGTEVVSMYVVGEWNARATCYMCSNRVGLLP